MADVLKYNEIKDLDAAAIDTKVNEMRREIFTMKMEKSTTGLEKPHNLKVLKKNIAKLLTAKAAKK
ncbi:MAG: 50S ribosomal protein L29 [Bdellovibrionota bacterium]|jgi:large subunit ribosomal protein L29|nr:50S ribosomal protein L29 [Bdellovibrionota bacterium]